MKVGYISDLHIDFNKEFAILDALDPKYLKSEG